MKSTPRLVSSKNSGHLRLELGAYSQTSLFSCFLLFFLTCACKTVTSTSLVIFRL